MMVDFPHLLIKWYLLDRTKTQTAYMTVVFHQSSGEVLDLLEVGTVINNLWTLVDVKSYDGTSYIILKFDIKKYFLSL